jgi:hypothetical protein
METKGNDFSIKVGKAFREVFMIGYEYQYADYRYQLQRYYSPQEFDVAFTLDRLESI